MVICAKILLLLLAVLSTCSSEGSDRFRGHVRKEKGQYQIITALEHDYVAPKMELEDVPAVAFWDQTYNVTGWSILEIKTFDNQTDFDQVYSAGLMEGRLTSGRKSNSSKPTRRLTIYSRIDWNATNEFDR